MTTENFYFIAYPKGDRSSITVIDLAHSVDYEREDWATVNDLNFSTPDEAITYARGLAEKYGLRYELFESRYNQDLNEEPTQALYKAPSIESGYSVLDLDREIAVKLTVRDLLAISGDFSVTNARLLGRQDEDLITALTKIRNALPDIHYEDDQDQETELFL